MSSFNPYGKPRQKTYKKWYASRSYLSQLHDLLYEILQGDAVKIEKLYEAIARIGSVRIQRVIPQVIAKGGTFCFMKFNF